jgi:predicted nucleic acid-binding protein
VTEAPPEALVLDASAMVETLLGTATGLAVRVRMRGCELHAPAHLDAEVLSALSRLHRAGEITAASVSPSLAELASAPIRRHSLPGLLRGAWDARERLRLADALYVELAGSISAVLITTDSRLARACDRAELVS